MQIKQNTTYQFGKNNFAQEAAWEAAYIIQWYWRRC